MQAAGVNTAEPWGRGGGRSDHPCGRARPAGGPAETSPPAKTAALSGKRIHCRRVSRSPAAGGDEDQEGGEGQNQEHRPGPRSGRNARARQPFTLDRRAAAPACSCWTQLLGGPASASWRRRPSARQQGAGAMGAARCPAIQQDTTAGPAVPGCVWSPGLLYPGPQGGQLPVPCSRRATCSTSAGHFPNAHTSSENPRIWDPHVKRRFQSPGKPRVGAKNAGARSVRCFHPPEALLCFPRAGGLQARVLAHGCALQGWEGTGPFRPVRWAGLPGAGGMCPGGHGVPLQSHCRW